MSTIVNASDLVNALTDGGIANLDGYVSRLTGGSSGAPESIYWHKKPRVAGAAAAVAAVGFWNDLWEYEGAPLSHGAPPGATARNPTNATAGAMMQTDPSTGTKRLLTCAATSTVGGMICIYDRLLDVSGMSGTVTTAQNVSGGASADVTRYTDGVGNQLWFEVYTTIGATATTITSVYKDGAGSSQTSKAVAFGGSNRSGAQRIVKGSLVGNTIKGVTSATLLASTTTAGDFGISIVHPLYYIPVVVAESGYLSGFLDGPLPAIQAGACLGMAWFAIGSAAPSVEIFATFAENA